MGIIGPIIAPHDPRTVNEFAVSLAPGTNWVYPLGADHFGRDILSRILCSMRWPFIVGVAGWVLGTCCAGLVVASKTEMWLPPGRVLEIPLARLSVAIILIAPLPLLLVMGAAEGPGFLQLGVPTAFVTAILPMALVYQAVRRTTATQASPEGEPSTTAAGEPIPVQLGLRTSVALAPVTFSLPILVALLLRWFLDGALPPDTPSLSRIVAGEGAWTAAGFPVGIVVIAAAALAAITLPISHYQKSFQVTVEVSRVGSMKRRVITRVLSVGVMFLAALIILPLPVLANANRRPLPEHPPLRVEEETLQNAMFAMMTENRLTRVDDHTSGPAVNDWAAFPAGTNEAPLSQYLPMSTSRFYFAGPPRAMSIL